MPATPCTTLQKMIGPIIIRTRLMKASPSGFIFMASSGCCQPRTMPATVATSTSKQSCEMRRKGLGAAAAAVAVIGPRPSREVASSAAAGLRRGIQSGTQTRIDATCIALEDLGAIGRAQWQCVQIPLRVVVVVAGAGVDAAHRSDHLGPEQDVVD